MHSSALFISYKSLENYRQKRARLLKFNRQFQTISGSGTTAKLSKNFVSFLLSKVLFRLTSGSVHAHNTLLSYKLEINTYLATLRAEKAIPFAVPSNDLSTDPVTVAINAVNEAENAVRTLNIVTSNAVQSRYLQICVR